jgi:hypothetical protein
MIADSSNDIRCTNHLLCDHSIQDKTGISVNKRYDTAGELAELF